MRPTGAHPPAGAEPTEPQRRGDLTPERRFTRRIECDGHGYYAGTAGPARGGGMRDPSAWRDPPRDPRR